ncbi:MAG: hypothetical protein GC149_19925 [Gammaproteobacteria bacterium]|nr:hypothetical protein [Gammaproteobacteria bacterium]
MSTVIRALRLVSSQGREYWWTAIIAFGLSLPLYLTTLPASYVGGTISLKALAFLDVKLTAFAVLLSALVAALAPLMVYLLREGRKSAKASATGGVLIGVFAPMLCCSPLLPLTTGAVATVLPALGGTVGIQVQYFIATYQTELLLLAAGLLALALYQNARRVLQGAHCRV